MEGTNKKDWEKTQQKIAKKNLLERCKEVQFPPEKYRNLESTK